MTHSANGTQDHGLDHGGLDHGGLDHGLAETVPIAAGGARAIAHMLGLLVDLPSTPDMVADAARDLLAGLEERIPPQGRTQSWETARSGEVELSIDEASAVAELLELLGEMPSTPPSVADDARMQAATLWERLP